MLKKLIKITIILSMFIIPVSLQAGGGGGDRGGGGTTKPSTGNVDWSIDHTCAYRVGGVRPWILGVATHFQPSGGQSTDYFRHQAGNEQAHFGQQNVGLSSGYARVTVGFSSCRNCQTNRQSYYVSTGQNTIYFNGYYAMKPR